MLRAHAPLIPRHNYAVKHKICIDAYFFCARVVTWTHQLSHI
jgi:hypothetical protein